MKKKLLVLIFLAVCICNIYAEYTVKQLMGTVWQNVDYRGDVKRISFTQDSVITTLLYFNPYDSMSFSFPYYLVDEHTEVFDFSKVGKTNNGNYIIEYNPSIPEVSCGEIKKLNADSLVIFFKAKPHNVGGADMTFTYTSVKTEVE